MYSNSISQVFTVKLAYNMGQPFVCGTLEEIIRYALLPNNGIVAFYELTNNKMEKVTKKRLKAMLSHGLGELSTQLFKKY